MSSSGGTPGAANLSGALLVDKSSGMTSYDAIRVLKRRFGFQTIGHAGTLDPMATGLLVILLGEATRLQSVVMEGKKRYEGIIRLGLGTSTDDLEGKTIAVDDERSYLSRDRAHLIESIRQKFCGPIVQRPPAVSAVKQDGERSYKLVRRGLEPELEERVVEIFSLDASFLDGENLAYALECSKGTYVRSLARDIGSLLGTFGCIAGIRRTGSGAFRVEDSHSLPSLEKLSHEELPLIGLGALVAHLPAVTLPAKDIELLQNGNQRPLAGVPARGVSLHALWSESGAYCGLLESGAEAATLRVRYLRRAGDPAVFAAGE